MLPLIQTSSFVFPAPTFGYLMSPSVYLAGASTNITPSNLGVNKVGVCLIVAPTNLPVTKATINVVTPQTGAKINVGVYTADGNTKLLDATISAAASNAQSVTGLSFTFKAGTAYYIAVSTDTSGVVLSGVSFGTPTGNMQAATANPTYGSAANSTSGNVMPSTLGTVTNSINNIGVAVMFS